MLKLNPIFKDYIWGGDKLKTLYGKQSELDKVAESWELSTHKDGECTIVEGIYKGKTLSAYIEEVGPEVLGTHSKTKDDLSILIKLIDAKDNLSVQVHPNDEYALAHEGDLGKTEMWYILEADEGAQLVYGFKKDMTRESFEAYIRNNTLTDVLNYVDVQKGDVFFIEPGTMHAIGKGIVIIEVQESSNVTYRVYDYGRVGVDGKPRALHIDQALEVTHLAKANQAKTLYELEEKMGYKAGTLVECEYFTVKKLNISNQVELKADETSFHSLIITDGAFKVFSDTEQVLVKKGDSLFIPAHYGTYRIEGQGEVILSTI